MRSEIKDTCAEIIERSRKHIAGGVVSLNRKVSPHIVFERAIGVNYMTLPKRIYRLPRGLCTDVALVKDGIYQFPAACKQGSVSYSHSETDIGRTLDIIQKLLKVI